MGQRLSSRPDAARGYHSEHGCPGEESVQQDTRVYKSQLGEVTFQRAAAIEGVLRDVINCEPPWEEAASILAKGSGDAWAAGDVTQELDDYVSRRNRIFHGGDLKTGGRFSGS